MKKTIAILLSLIMVLGMVVACAKPATEAPKTEEPKAAEAPKAEEPKKEEAPKATEEPKATEVPLAPWDGAYMDRDDYKAYVKNDLDMVMAAIEDQLEDATYAAVKAAREDAEKAIDAAATLAEVRAAYEAGFKAIAECIPLADGLFSYNMDSNAERTNVLGILERYAVTTGITGISLFENGGYVMYNPV